MFFCPRFLLLIIVKDFIHFPTAQITQAWRRAAVMNGQALTLCIVQCVCVCVYTNCYFTGSSGEVHEKLQNVNLQKNAMRKKKKKKDVEFVWISYMAWTDVTVFFFFATISHQSACSESADGRWTPFCDSLTLCVCVCVCVKDETNLWIWCHCRPNDHSASFSNCLSVWSELMIVLFHLFCLFFFITCELILQVQNNVRCRNGSFFFPPHISPRFI